MEGGRAKRTGCQRFAASRLVSRQIPGTDVSQKSQVAGLQVRKPISWELET
jgi:hypothetical protein